MVIFGTYTEFLDKESNKKIIVCGYCESDMGFMSNKNFQFIQRIDDQAICDFCGEMQY